VRLVFALAAVILLTSGAFELRAADRAGLGTPVPSLLVLAAALALGAVAVLGPPGRAAGLLLLAGAFLLVVGSALHLTRRLRRQARFRRLTEGRRLETYLRYLSEPDDGTPRG
jgi:hypothetical protein